MPALSGKQRKAQLKLKRAIKRGDAQRPRQLNQTTSRNARSLQSQFVKLDKHFLDDTKALANVIVLRRPIQSDVAVQLRHEIAPLETQLALPKRPKWRYQMSKDELDANEQAYFHTWIAQQDAIVEQWQRALNADPSRDDSETRPMPYPPTHFERNIEVWRQFWRVTEISQILLVLLDSRCPPLHLPSSLSAYLNISTLQSFKTSRFLRIILVLTKVDISGHARAASWTSFLNDNYPGVPVIPVEAYAPKSSLNVDQGPTRYEPHLPGTFRERLVHTLRNVHEQLLQPPQWVTTPRDGETEEERLQRIGRWRPRVKTVIDWDGVLKARGKWVGKTVGGAAVPKGKDQSEVDEGEDVHVSDSEEEQTTDTHEWKEPEFLTVGVIGQPNVGKSSLLNAIFGTTRVRASRTPGKTKHFQTLFWTSDIRLVDCPGLVMPSFIPMDIQVLSGVLPISRISAVPFCVHQLARLLPLEVILELKHPSLSTSPAFAMTSGNNRSPISQSSKIPLNSKPASKAAPSTNSNSIEDKRTWRPGQRPLAQTRVQSSASAWTANDIMIAYAEKKGWVTAKAGRPDIHRAGNAILRLVAEGKIPWAFWPPGSSVSGDDGIWLKDGVQQHAWDELENQDEEGSESEMSSDEDDPKASFKVASGESDDDKEEEEEEEEFGRGNLGRFGALRIDD